MPPTVLIVDDHPSFRVTARALLEAEGFDVVGEAEDGETALEEAARLHPDVVLLDVQLPGIDGFEVAARLTSWNGASPAVVLTSSRDATEFSGLVERSGAARLRREGRALGSGADGPAQVILGRRPWVAVLPVGLAAGGIALALVLTSDSQHTSLVEGLLQLLLGWSFIGTGLYAWARRPRNRTGRLMVGFGFVWFLGALSFADSSLPYTLGNAVGALSLAVFIHLLFAFPNGHLESRAERVLVGLAYPTALLANLTVLPFDSTPVDDCPKCPSNAFLVTDSQTTANALDLFWSCVGGAFMIAAAILLVRRWRASSAPARRVLGPVYVGGLASLLVLTLGFALSEVTSAGNAVLGIGLIAFMSVPFLFLAGLLRTRLARTTATQLLQETGESPPLEETEATLRRLLNDPTLRLLVRENGGGYVDSEGRSVEPPPGSATEAVTPLEYEGEPIAVVVHDPALRDEPELLDDVLAAARVALVKDRSVQALRASERRNRALLAAIPDNMFRIRGDGTYVDFHSNRPEATVPPARADHRLADRRAPPRSRRRAAARGDPPGDRDRRSPRRSSCRPSSRTGRSATARCGWCGAAGTRCSRSPATSPTASAPSAACCASATSSARSSTRRRASSASSLRPVRPCASTRSASS